MVGTSVLQLHSFGLIGFCGRASGSGKWQVLTTLLCLSRRKSKQALRDYKKVQIQLENLETSVRDRCKKEFTGKRSQERTVSVSGDVESSRGLSGMVPFEDQDLSPACSWSVLLCNQNSCSEAESALSNSQMLGILRLSSELCPWNFPCNSQQFPPNTQSFRGCKTKKQSCPLEVKWSLEPFMSASFLLRPHD